MDEGYENRGGQVTRRDEVLQIIREHVAANGYPPTVREIAAALGVGHSTAQRAILELIAEGKIERQGGAARGLKVNG